MSGQDWRYRQRRFKQYDEQFEGLGGRIGRLVAFAALRRWFDYEDNRSPLPPEGYPTMQQFFRLRDADLLAEYNFGHRKLEQWRAWKAAHPLASPPLPEWLAEE